MKNKNSQVLNYKGKEIVVESAHPGVFLKEEITFSQISENEIMAKLNISADHLIGIISGENDISSELSTKIGDLFGTHPEYWYSLQVAHDGYKNLNK